VEALAARAPAPDGTGLMDFLKNIDASRQNSGVASPEPLEKEDAALSRSTVINAQRPEAVIIDAFKRLGLDFESALLKSQSADGSDTQAQNLKVRLLALQSAIDSTTSNTEIPDTQKVLMDNKAILLDIAAKLNALVQSAQLTVHENESSVHTQTVSKDFFSSLENSAKEIVGRMQDSGTGTLQQLADKIKDLADMVRDFAQRTVAGEERLPKELAERITGQTRQQSEIESLTKNILKQLDGAVKSLTETGVSPALRDLAGHLTDLASQTTKLAEKLAPFDRGPLDTLKQQVEQVLTRVESMQVLAKQVSFADNQQQVISLPMKIDGQWTDVVVKFLKRKGPSKKGPSKKNVSVVIHVAPTLLGEVTVFMDYNGKKNFSMRMEFEKTSSRVWFENNRTEFSKAMGNFGFPSFKIDMKTSRDRKPVDTIIETALPSAGTIDIKA
jgi:hypothetical protein